MGQHPPPPHTHPQSSRLLCKISVSVIASWEKRDYLTERDFQALPLCPFSPAGGTQRSCHRSSAQVELRVCFVWNRGGLLLPALGEQGVGSGESQPSRAETLQKIKELDLSAAFLTLAARDVFLTIQPCRFSQFISINARATLFFPLSPAIRRSESSVVRR